MIHKEISIQIGNKKARLVTYVQENNNEVDVERKRPAVLICPGGGYLFTSEREAEPIALQMVQHGYQAFVLYYSVGSEVFFPEALLQTGRAMQLIREHADEWHIATDKIAVFGFSAGGHLAASLGVFWNQSFMQEKLGNDASLWKPNALMLAYPVISDSMDSDSQSIERVLGEKYPDQKEYLSLETQVSKDTPPTFLWHTLEDALVPVENSLLFAASLRRENVPFELHIFAKGVHGLSLANAETNSDAETGWLPSVAVWPELVKNWLDTLWKVYE